jgi:hypothetical protein
MKLYCKAEYHNNPAGMHFDGPGVIEIDAPKAEFLLRDAPENFTTELPEAPAARATSFDQPVRDTAMKAPRRNKAATGE